LVHGSGPRYLMGTEYPRAATDEVPEAKPVQACEVSVPGPEWACVLRVACRSVGWSFLWFCGWRTVLALVGV
jgi:hypothetical protein